MTKILADIRVRYPDITITLPSPFKFLSLNAGRVSEQEHLRDAWAEEAVSSAVLLSSQDSVTALILLVTLKSQEELHLAARLIKRFGDALLFMAISQETRNSPDLVKREQDVLLAIKFCAFEMEAAGLVKLPTSFRLAYHPYEIDGMVLTDNIPQHLAYLRLRRGEGLYITKPTPSYIANTHAQDVSKLVAKKTAHDEKLEREKFERDWVKPDLKSGTDQPKHDSKLESELRRKRKRQRPPRPSPTPIPPTEQSLVTSLLARLEEKKKASHEAPSASTAGAPQTIRIGGRRNMGHMKQKAKRTTPQAD